MHEAYWFELTVACAQQTSLSGRFHSFEKNARSRTGMDNCSETYIIQLKPLVSVILQRLGKKMLLTRYLVVHWPSSSFCAVSHGGALQTLQTLSSGRVDELLQRGTHQQGAHI